MTYVLSDIHGNLPRFNSIMKQIDLKPDDRLYVLGDVIDRFPDGIKILRTLMAMPNVYMLLGNHEYMMLKALAALETKNDSWEAPRPVALWYRNGGAVTHRYFKHIRKTVRKEIIDYLQALPLNIDIEVDNRKFKLVHASPCENFIPNRGYESPAELAVWKRWLPGHPIPEDRTLIFGHTPTVYFTDASPMQIAFIEDNAIGIDCGAGYISSTGRNSIECRLGCLRLDDMKEFYSEEVCDE